MRINFKKFLFIPVLLLILIPYIVFAEDEYTVPQPTVQGDYTVSLGNKASTMISWSDEPAGEFGFVIEKELESDKAFAAIYEPDQFGLDEQTIGDIYADQAVEVGKTYTYYITTFDRAGNTSDPGTVTLTIEPLLEINNIKTTDISDTSANISWDTVPDSKGEILYSKDTSYSQKAEATATQSHQILTLTGLESNSTYHYKIHAFTEEGDEAYSDDQAFTTSSPLTITGPNFSNITPTSTTASWAVNFSSSSVFDFSLNGNAVGSIPNSAATSQTINITGLRPGKVYNYTLKVTKDGTTQTASKTGTFSTPCYTVSNSSVDTTTNFPDVKISWTSPYNLNGWLQYKKSTEDDTKWQSADYSGTSPLVNLTNLDLDTTYYYRITAERLADSCIISSGSFTLGPLTHTLTLVSVQEDRATFHWQSNAPTTGTINFNIGMTSGGTGTKQANWAFAEPTRDKNIDSVIPISDIQNYVGTSNYQMLGVSANSTAVYRNQTKTSSIVYFTVNEPQIYSAKGSFNIQTYPTLTGTPNQLNLSFNGNGYYGQYDFSQATLLYQIIDNNGGVYTTAESKEATMDLTANKGASTIDATRSWAGNAAATVSLKSAKVRQSGQVLTAFMAVIGSSANITGGGPVQSISVQGDGSLMKGLWERTYFPYGITVGEVPSSGIKTWYQFYYQDASNTDGYYYRLSLSLQGTIASLALYDRTYANPPSGVTPSSAPCIKTDSLYQRKYKPSLFPNIGSPVVNNIINDPRVCTLTP